jgi:hypothetical protein
MRARDALLDSLKARTSGEAARWLTAALDTAEHGDRTQLLAAFTSASRALGRLSFTLADGTAFPPPEAAGLSLEHWTIADAARVALLLVRADALAPEVFAGDAIECYEQGDAGEQESWLKGASLLPAPERFRPLVVDACRTNILPQFEAVACGNPYPSLYFPDANFNQLVMKALFNAVRLDRIVGLPARANAELARMAGDFAAERTAAGRAVPADIGLAMAGAAA